MSQRVHEAPTDGLPPITAAVAYARFEPDRRALKRAELLPVNLDPVTVVIRVYGTCHRLRQLDLALPGDPRGLDRKDLDRLEDLARALSHAHALRKTAHEPDDQLAALHAEARELRDTLRADLRPLIQRGLVPKPGPRFSTGRSGYKNASTDLFALALFFDNHKASLVGRSCIQPADLGRAQRLAIRLLRTVGLRAHAPKRVAAASEERQRAYTLVLRAYDEVRRAVGFLRWHQGDAEKLAPSLWKGRGRRRRRANEPLEDTLKG